MKKSMMLILMFIILGNMMCEIKAEELMSVDDYNLSDVQNVIDENEYVELDFKDMVREFMKGESSTVIVDTIKHMLQAALSDINIGKECISNILLIAIVSAFFTNFARVFTQSSVSDTGFYICYMAIMIVLITIFGTASKIAVNILELVVEFMSALVPAFFLSVGMVGQTSAVGFYQITLIVIMCVNYVFLNVIIPILKVYLVLALANNISSEDFLSKTIELMKKGVVFLNKSMLGIVVGINVIQGLVLPQVDNLKNTAIKKMAGALPVVGDSSDYVTNVFLGSGMLIKDSLGTVAIVVIICICFIPVVKLFLIMCSLQLSAAVIQPIADGRIIKSISYVSEGINLMLRTVMTSAFLFVVSIALVCMMTK